MDPMGYPPKDTKHPPKNKQLQNPKDILPSGPLPRLANPYVAVSPSSWSHERPNWSLGGSREQSDFAGGSKKRQQMENKSWS